jgi:transcriptional regulator with XRE-family HTH domain
MSSVALNFAVQSGLRQCGSMVKRLPHPANSDLLKGFGPRLRAARDALGFRQGEFARLLRVTPQRLANWEADINPPEPYIFVQLKQIGISLDYLLAGDMGNLSHKLMQGLVNQGAKPADGDVAAEVRDAMKQDPEPTTTPPRGRLHQRQAPPPRRFIHPPDVQ